jgi:hypothetical protein
VRKALGVAALFLLCGPAAQADEATRLDRFNGVRFTLDGRALTAALVPLPDARPPDVREDVWGKLKAVQRVTTIVVTHGTITIGTDLAENRRARRIARRRCGLVRSSGVPGPAE